MRRLRIFKIHIYSIADNEYAFPKLRASIIGRVKHFLDDLILITLALILNWSGNLIEDCLYRPAAFPILQSADILHYEANGQGLPDNTDELQDQPASWVVQSHSIPRKAEALARRSANNQSRLQRPQTTCFKNPLRWDLI